MVGLSRQETRTLTGLGLAAFVGLGLLLWKGRGLPYAMREISVLEAAEWDGALARARQIDINRAEAAELERLPGIGPALARRIVAYRDAHGPFRFPDELLGVSGIGPKTFEALQEYLTLR